LGDQAWKELAVRDVKDMVRRDRNHPAVVIWGVRINESANDPALYRRTTKAAKALDDSRSTSGTMTHRSTENWSEDVFAFDDYHAAPDGSVDIAQPLPGVPYLVAEAVGQFNYGAGKGFDSKYRRAGDVALQQKQAILHAQAHSKGAANPRCAGVIAWCAFDYGSLINSYDGVKCPGIADIFRIPKLGASFYLAQVDPRIRPVIEPDFYWDFGPNTPSGPGKKAAIFSNCERLELFINGNQYASVEPDRANFPHLKHSPFFADLELDADGHPELRIDGYVGQALAMSRSFSSDPAKDQLLLRADDTKLVADGSDATRLVFHVADQFGAPRPFVGGQVTLQTSGPGVIVGDNPFQLAAGGGAGAVWIKSLQGQAGRITVVATHSPLIAKSVEIDVFL
jgi:beta-galactosidase